MAFSLTLTILGLYFLIRKILFKLVTLFKATYLTFIKRLLFSKSKPTTAEVKFKPRNLLTVYAQDNTKANCVLLIDGDVVLYSLRFMEVSPIFIGTHLLFLR